MADQARADHQSFRAPGAHDLKLLDAVGLSAADIRRRRFIREQLSYDVARLVYLKEVALALSFFPEPPKGLPKKRSPGASPGASGGMGWVLSLPAARRKGASVN
jgi:hypothetical protein